MLIAKGTLTHVSQLNRALGAGIHEPVTALRVKLGGSDDLGKLFHVRGFDIDNVETLVLDVQVPQVYAKVVTADKGLAIAVDGYAVDVVGMGVGIRLPRDGSDNSIVVGQTRQLKVTDTLDEAGQDPWCASAYDTAGCSLR